MRKLRRLIEDAEDVLKSYAVTQDRKLFQKVSTEMIEEIRKNCSVAVMNVCAQNIVIGLFPHITLTEQGQQYFADFDANAEKVTLISSCHDLLAQQFFCMHAAITSFIQSLKDTDEEMTVCILYAVGKISQDLATSKDMQMIVCANNDATHA